MKKLIAIFLLILLYCCESKAQYVNIPDEMLKSELRWKYPACFNAAGQIDTTCSAILNEDSLLLNSQEIVTLEGIQYFKNLTLLQVGGYRLVSIPAYPSSLKSLSLGGLSVQTLSTPFPIHLEYLRLGYCTALTTLPPLPATLEYLNLSGCFRLQSIAELPPNLTYLNVYETGLTTLPALPERLDTLNCSKTSITAIPELPNGMRYLNCSAMGQITGLPRLPDSLKILFAADLGRLNSLPALPGTLQQLGVTYTQIRSLPDLPATLIELSIGSNYYLQHLPTLPQGLKTIWASGCRLVELPALPDSLTLFYCSSNRLTNLPPLPNKLRQLNLFGNQLTTLPALPGSLEYFICGRNNLTSLPALPAKLTYLNCEDNQITNLPPLPNRLVHLDCGHNLITSLPTINSGLGALDCSNNLLSNLPALPDSMATLDCSFNNIAHLPALPRRLESLNCSDNQLTELPELPTERLDDITCTNNNIYCLPKLPNTYGLVIWVDDKIKCKPNALNSANVYTYVGRVISNLPLCNPTNNANHCTSFPFMRGTVFYDTNGNNIKDAGELVKPNAKIYLSNNTTTFTNSNGEYEINTTDTGSYTLSLTPPTLYTVAPASYHHRFTSNDTMVTGNFALQTNVVKDSLTIQVWPVNWAARPGFPFAYMVRFENAGTTHLASSVVLQYDADRLNYDSVSNASVLHNGNLLNLATGNLAPGQGNQFVAYFRVKPTVVIGDSLLAEATISNSNLSVTTNNRIAIRGSFDPNDKQATPQLSPSQVASGEYIDYTIRFQNTGTDTAFNIVVTDTINNQLQVSTLQILATSHPCKTTVKNGIVYFEFLNVLLEDSNHNEPKSHGFVLFKIKPISTVSTNSGIPNKAAIYFDYNAPVITNTATTLIRDYVVLPLHLVAFSAIPQPDNTSRLEWTTTNEVNCRNFVIEQSTNGYHFTALTSIPAKGSYSNNYSSLVRDASGSLQYYRLKMMDNDGRSTYSPIVKIDRRKNGQGFAILTNPVKDALVLNNTNSSLNNTTCSMINSQGAVIKRFIIRSGNQRIDTRELPAGIYYLKTAMGSTKIIIQ